MTNEGEEMAKVRQMAARFFRQNPTVWEFRVRQGDFEFTFIPRPFGPPMLRAVEPVNTEAKV